MLKSQLLIPKIDHTIPRKRFYAIFDEMRRKPLFTVVAGAGYGKTTLIAQALQYLNLPAVWYRADAWDTAFTNLFHDISLGIQDRYPAFTKAAARFIGAAGTTARKQKAALMAWLETLEACIPDRLIIVIDDFQHFNDNDAVTDAFSFLLDRLPVQIGWVFISRSEPRLRLSTYRARRQLVEITEPDLIFTREETRRLFHDSLHESMDAAVLDRIHQKSSGWVSGLILFHHLLSKKTPLEIAEFLEDVTGSAESLAAFLEDNVYAALCPEIKTFLMKTSVLTHLESRLCDRILGIENSAEILSFIAAHHLFTFSLDGMRENFYFHQLFREFLQSKLEACHSREQINALHVTIAEVYTAEGRTLEAIQHFLMAGGDEAGARLLEESGLFLILQGKLSHVAGLLDKLPDSIFRKQPRLMQLKGLTLFLSGRLRDSLAVLRRALHIFRDIGDTMGMAACRKDLAIHYYYAGDVRDAISQLQQVVSEETTPMLAMEANGLLIFLSAVLGRLKAADGFHKAALQQLHCLPPDQHEAAKAFVRLNESYRYCVSGDFSRSMDIIEKALEVFKSRNLDVFLPLTYFQLSYTGFFLRRFEEGSAYARAGLAAADAVGVHDNQVAWLHYGLALNCSGMNKNREAVENALESLVIFEEMGNPWGQAMAYEALFRAKFNTPSLSHEAEPHLLAGLNAIRGLRHDMTKGLLKLGLARCRMEAGAWRNLLPILSAAQAEGAASKFHMAMTLLQKARYFHYRGMMNRTAECLAAAFEISADHGYGGWILSEKRWLAPILMEIYGRGLLQQEIRELFTGWGEEGRRLLILQGGPGRPSRIRRAAGHLLEKGRVPPIYVCFLGEFQVFRGDQPIAPDRWKSKKAKMLFKYLASRPERGYIHRDELIELLWPDQSPDKTMNRFHVALNALRRVLEPGLARGTPSAYLLKEENAYRISLGEGGGTDVAAFVEAAKAAGRTAATKRRLELLLKADALYHGHFLQEDPYSEWCRTRQRELEMIHLDIISGIVDAYETLGQWRLCAKYAARYIDEEPYAETMYRRLMRFHAALGENAMVIQTYDRCRAAIVADLDGDLSRETEALYRALV